MIRYDLKCGAGHGFDAWFRSSGDFDAQAERGLLACPHCGSSAVTKALMAPSLSSGKTVEATAPAPSNEVALASEGDGKLRELLTELKRHVHATSEDVGDRFPEVARKMHAEEIEHRSIRGRASVEEAKALADEGVPIQPLPRFPDEAN